MDPNNGFFSFSDESVTTGTGYLYQVWAINHQAEVLAYSGTDLAVPFDYVDGTLTSGDPVRAAHFNDLRQATNAGRAALAWTPLQFGTISPGAPISAANLTSLRTAIEALLEATRLSGFLWTDDPPIPGSTLIKLIHVMELRNALD